MANSIEKAKIFQSALDEQLIQEMTTGWMEANAGMVKYNGGNEVKIPKMVLGGLGDYNRSTGYNDGAVTLTFETHAFDMDRSKKFRLDRMDVDESNFVANASAVMGEFQRTKVAPEVDAYRYSKIFKLANASLKTGAYTPVDGTVLGKLKNDIAAVQDFVGEMTPLVICMSFEAANVLDQADKIEKKLSVDSFSAGNVNLKVRTLDGIPIIRVSSDRFKTDYTFGSTGYAATATAMRINWVIIAKTAPIGVVKTDVPKIIEPSVNQSADAWDIAMRKYHALWIPENKLSSVWVSYTPISAPALTATFAAGSAVGTTKVTATAGTGNKLAYSITEAAVTGVNFNDVPTGLTAYTSDADITITDTKFLNVYVLDATGHVQKFISHDMAANEIKSN